MQIPNVDAAVFHHFAILKKLVVTCFFFPAKTVGFISSIFIIFMNCSVTVSGRAVSGVGLGLFASWDCGFGSRLVHRCML